MKRVCISLVICLLAVCLFGCTAHVTVKSGTYLLDGEADAPYININGDGTYMQGAGMYFSYAAFGTYTVDGATLTLTPDDSEAVTRLTVNEDGSLTVETCENGGFGLKTGDRFTASSQ